MFALRHRQPDRASSGPQAAARWARSRALGWLLGLCLVLLTQMAALPTAARTDAVQMTDFEVRRNDGAVSLDFGLRLRLPPVVDDALQRGVPLYFVARATLMRPRWYWRDERVARASRTWRLSYQPLAGSYRVSLGALHQTYGSLSEALLAITRLSGWRIADSKRVDPNRHYVLVFSWQLDTEQLPPPMQIGIGGAADWVIGVERTVPVPP